MTITNGHIVIFAIPAKFLLDAGIATDMNQSHLCEVSISKTDVNRESGMIFTVSKDDSLHNLKFHQFTFANKISENESVDLSGILSLRDGEDNFPEIYAMPDEDFRATMLKVYNRLLNDEIDVEIDVA